MTLPEPIILAANWTKGLIRPGLVQHKHGLPVCWSEHHDEGCEAMGPELVCIEVIKGYDFKKREFIRSAVCTHRRK